MSIGALTLSPTFDASVKEYTAATTNASNKVEATAGDGVTIKLTVNDVEKANGSSVTWNDGENTVVIALSDADGHTAQYTVTVTKS